MRSLPFLLIAFALLCTPLLGGELEPVADGPFKADWDSLEHYECPEWFRDAKFGIWAHWTAQCVPEQGDWYARRMYISAGPNGKPDADYTYHVEHYGHPSKFGFKDIDHIWHAEHWDPEKLIALYKRAGAKYFVALANHHDNLDCWDSKYQPWNSVKVGPRKDIVAGWEKAARAAGLRFGVTVHASRAWSWYEPAQGSDPSGPLKGVPYDGKMSKADGKGLWWEGLDPQDLYAQNHAPGTKLEWDWDKSKGSSIPDEAYCEKFYNRTIDLINKFHPDLLYFDDHVLPLYPVSDVGLKIAAHYYNSSVRQHGRNEGVLTGKILSPEQRKAILFDIERGRTDHLDPLPWQTDTCIGDWHYRRSLFEQHKYKTAGTVVTMLIDIVSKNGNLLLNIPVRGDGTIDGDEMKFLEDFTKWMDVNGEGIFATRPWVIFGEGAPDVSAGDRFNERNARAYSATDIRFTSKGETVYAFVMGRPESGKIVIRSMAKNSPLVSGEPAEIRLLGHDGKIEFSRTDTGLEIQFPPDAPGNYAFTFKITGLQTNRNADTSNLPYVPKPAPPPAPGAKKKGKKKG